MQIAFLYGLFAVFATLVNLVSQWTALQMLSPLHLSRNLDFLIPLMIGTGTGLIAKYVLDKRYIFHDMSSGAAAHTKKFSLYTVMGLLTTMVFWGFELAGTWLDPQGAGRYLGGAMGLAIGYVVKYQLDKTFVFEATDGFRPRS